MICSPADTFAFFAFRVVASGVTPPHASVGVVDRYQCHGLCFGLTPFRVKPGAVFILVVIQFAALGAKPLPGNFGRVRFAAMVTRLFQRMRY